MLTAEVQELASLLSAHPDYRVLRRFRPRYSYPHPEDARDLRRGIYLDIEGTGLDTAADEVIELAMLPFEFDEHGRVYGVGPGMSWLREPTRPITPEIQELTHITPEMVQGRAIDISTVEAMLAGTALIIAHNASYDRPMAERIHRAFAEISWACSQREVDWKRFGVAGGALANILMTTTGEFPDTAHRALADCEMGVHVLAAATLEDKTALGYLLESARQPVHRVLSWGAPRWAKDALKARKYRAWYVGDSFQCWYRDVSAAQINDEFTWLHDEAACFHPEVRKISAKDRYSVRAA